MPSKRAIKILVVDDHELVRKSLSSLLPEPWEVCGEAADGEEAILQILQLKPDVVLLDLSMPIMGGTATARYIRRIAPEIKLVLMSIQDPSAIEEIAKAVDAHAFLSKNCSVAEFRKTIAALVEPCASV